MKQQKIANWLKGIVIFLALLGVIYSIGIYLLPQYVDITPPGNIYGGFHLFRWWTLLFCYIILFIFWNVCTQIGKGNSFSKENATAFHRISLCGIAILLGFVAEYIWAYAFDYLTIPSLAFIGFKTAVFIIFVILCEALSKLVLHAYEIRQENELTI